MVEKWAVERRPAFLESFGSRLVQLFVWIIELMKINILLIVVSGVGMTLRPIWLRSPLRQRARPGVEGKVSFSPVARSREGAGHQAVRGPVSGNVLPVSCGCTCGMTTRSSGVSSAVVGDISGRRSSSRSIAIFSRYTEHGGRTETLLVIAHSPAPPASLRDFSGISQQQIRTRAAWRGTNVPVPVQKVPLLYCNIQYKRNTL
jgi:hypothetical protein